MNNKIAGACHCGAIKFVLNEPPRLVVNCHCDACKRRNGSAFSTYLASRDDKLQITQGADSLKSYEAANEGIKYFCGHCGSPLYNRNYRLPGLCLVFYGACNDAGQFTPDCNVFCDSKHDWVGRINVLKSYTASIEK